MQYPFISLEYSERKPFDGFNLQGYIGTKLEVIGVPSPVLRKMRSDYESELKPEEKFYFWQEQWFNHPIFEAKSLALYFLETLAGKRNIELLPQIQSWTPILDNWAHADAYASIVNKRLKFELEGVLELAETWHKSEFLWEKRLSLTALMPRPTILMDLTEIRVRYILDFLDEKNPFMQKAVGWLLREAREREKAIYDDLIWQNIHKISATAFSYATEKMDKSQKEELKALRKSGRKNR